MTPKISAERILNVIGGACIVVAAVWCVNRLASCVETTASTRTYCPPCKCQPATTSEYPR